MSEQTRSIKDIVLAELDLTFKPVSQLPKETIVLSKTEVDAKGKPVVEHHWKPARLTQYALKNPVEGESPWTSPMFTTAIGSTSNFNFGGKTYNLSSTTYTKDRDGSIKTGGAYGKQKQVRLRDEHVDMLLDMIDKDELYIFVDVGENADPSCDVLSLDVYKTTILQNPAPSMSSEDITSQEQTSDFPV